MTQVDDNQYIYNLVHHLFKDSDDISSKVLLEGAYERKIDDILAASNEKKTFLVAATEAKNEIVGYINANSKDPHFKTAAAKIMENEMRAVFSQEAGTATPTAMPVKSRETTQIE